MLVDYCSRIGFLGYVTEDTWRATCERSGQLPGQLLENAEDLKIHSNTWYFEFISAVSGQHL